MLTGLAGGWVRTQFRFLSSADEILVAAPLRITDITSGLLGGEDGRVYVYNGKQTTFGDMTGRCKSWAAPCPEEKVTWARVES